MATDRTRTVNIIYIGDTDRKDTARRLAPVMHQAHHVLSDFRAIDIIGDAISATTTGRMPLNMLMTVGLSLKFVKAIAMANIIRKEGSIEPNVAVMLPFSPLIL